MSYNLDYGDNFKLRQSLEIMKRRDWIVGNDLVVFPMTREFTLPDGGKYVDKAVVSLTINKEKKLDFDVLLRRRNTQTQLATTSRTVFLTSEDVNAVYELIFSEGFIPTYFASLEGEIAPVVLDAEGKVVKAEVVANKEEKKLKVHQARYKNHSILDLVGEMGKSSLPAVKAKSDTVVSKKKRKHATTAVVETSKTKRAKKNVIIDSEDSDVEEDVINGHDAV